jgi:hypothetical protein
LGLQRPGSVQIVATRMSGCSAASRARPPGTLIDMFGVLGTGGAVGLQVDPDYRLPQQYADGDVVVRVGTSWSCSGAPRPSSILLGRAPGSDGNHIGDDWATVGSALDVPAGKWAIVADL